MGDLGSLATLILAAIFGGIIALSLLFYFVPVGLWISALFAGVRVNLIELIGMRLRRVAPPNIVKPMINASKAGITAKYGITVSKLEGHLLARGNVARVVSALIASDKAGINLTFERATAIDLAGRDVLEAVQVSVNPRVISTPLISAISQDGVQLKATARITVRANIERLVGGAGEETILARVGEGIVSAIGSSLTYAEVLENPDMISRRVLDRGLDSGTAYEILSIDIADIDVGENIGARLEAEQAETDLVVAQAKAEERLAMAKAQEQEGRARVQEMQAKVVESEALIPRSIGTAFGRGNIRMLAAPRD
ncbi:MAG: flotillin-like protein FloA [Candidatus Poribacteria bacterium]|nr:flotillin-like protein FloA [Candidatus Poribacteria bacterium]